MNSGHWLGSFLACNSTTIRSTFPELSQFMNKYWERDKVLIVEMSI